MDTKAQPITTVPFRLTEAFFTRRSYTHLFDDYIGFDVFIQSTLPNGSHVVKAHERTRMIQVEADEIYQPTKS